MMQSPHCGVDDSQCVAFVDRLNATSSSSSSSPQRSTPKRTRAGFDTLAYLDTLVIDRVPETPPQAEASVAACEEADEGDEGARNVRRSKRLRRRSLGSQLEAIPLERSCRQSVSELRGSVKRGSWQRRWQLEAREVCDGRGRGVFVRQAVPQGELVAEYRGEMMSRAEGKQREQEYASEGIRHCYQFFLSHQGRQLCIDATRECDDWGVVRLINHSYLRPNLYARKLVVDGQPRIVLISGCDIAAGEELLFDYGERRESVVDEYPWMLHS